MMIKKIEALEKENFQAYFESLWQRMEKFLSQDITQMTRSLIKRREDVFISAKIFESRKFYFKALLNNLDEVTHIK